MSVISMLRWAAWHRKGKVRSAVRTRFSKFHGMILVLAGATVGDVHDMVRRDLDHGRHRPPLGAGSLEVSPVSTDRSRIRRVVAGQLLEALDGQLITFVAEEAAQGRVPRQRAADRIRA